MLRRPPISICTVCGSFNRPLLSFLLLFFFLCEYSEFSTQHFAPGSFFRKSSWLTPKRSVHVNVSCGNGSMRRGGARRGSLVPTRCTESRDVERNSWFGEGRVQGRRPPVSFHDVIPAAYIAACKNSS